jgi:hypothetical protein
MEVLDLKAFQITEQKWQLTSTSFKQLFWNWDLKTWEFYLLNYCYYFLCDDQAQVWHG